MREVQIYSRNYTEPAYRSIKTNIVMEGISQEVINMLENHLLYVNYELCIMATAKTELYGYFPSLY